MSVLPNVGQNIETGISANPLSRLAKRVTLVVLSVVITAIISHLDSIRQGHNQSRLALRWARQMVVQAETLSFTATEKGNPDPLGWAARILSQGTDSRILSVSKYKAVLSGPIPVGDPIEQYEIDTDTGVFEYAKTLSLADSTGIKIKLYTSRLGIFGAKSRLGQDLTLAAIFFVTFCLLHLFSTPKKVIDEALLSASAHATQFKAQVQDWLSEAKTALKDLGTHIREMTRAAHKISGCAIQSQECLSDLRNHLHDTLAALRAKPKNSNELTTVAQDAENIFRTADDDTKALIRKLMTVTLKHAAISGAIEGQLQQLVSHCDQAYESLQDVSASARSMSKEIKDTTDGILQHSRMISDLKSRVA